MEYKIAKDPDALLGALAEHERAIARLYQAYSSRFDEYGIFWGDLAQEELKHAACLNKLRRLLRENPAIVIVERFSVDAIRFSIDYVNELIGRAGQQHCRWRKNWKNPCLKRIFLRLFLVIAKKLGRRWSFLPTKQNGISKSFAIFRKNEKAALINRCTP